jgi:hypothetical protein
LLSFVQETFGSIRTLGSWASAPDKYAGLIVAYRASVILKGLGRASNNKLLEGIREYAVELVRSHYADFGPTLAAEMLLSKHALRASRETLRKWMVADGIWRSRSQRRCFHQPRLRREVLS